MNHFKFYIFALLAILSISACTKVIDLKLGNDTGKLVIEGNITDVHGQVIKLSQNVPFTNTNTYPAVTGATVTVSDGFNNFRFTEGPQGTYTANRLVGLQGITYTMTVVTNGQTYRAVSKMPLKVNLDSITESKSLFKSSDDLREISVHFRDPAGRPDQYNFLMYVNNVQVKDVFAYDDDFTDGRDVDIDLMENDIDIHPGDTVRVEMQCIDKPMFTYWFTLMQQNGDFGQGVTPSNPPTNITPVTLGYFSAHTTQTKTVVVK
jgi:hypothetical protein